MKIINCGLDDIPLMQQFYGLARAYQQSKGMRHWLNFDESLLQDEIRQSRQWKILEGKEVACIFMTAYDDPYIWGPRNADPSVYIHRIVTHPDWRGQQYTSKIIAWAKNHGRLLNKKFIRMDTWGDNPQLIEYYRSCGFRYLETIVPAETDNLPPHYSCISLSLFEIEIDQGLNSEERFSSNAGRNDLSSPSNATGGAGSSM